MTRANCAFVFQETLDIGATPVQMRCVDHPRDSALRLRAVLFVHSFLFKTSHIYCSLWHPWTAVSLCIRGTDVQTDASPLGVQSAIPFLLHRSWRPPPAAPHPSP